MHNTIVFMDLDPPPQHRINCLLWWIFQLQCSRGGRTSSKKPVIKKPILKLPSLCIFCLCKSGPDLPLPLLHADDSALRHHDCAILHSVSSKRGPVEMGRGRCQIIRPVYQCLLHRGLWDVEYLCAGSIGAVCSITQTKINRQW